MNADNLQNQLYHVIEGYVSAFIKEIVKRNQWNEEELMEKWKECSTHGHVMLDVKKKKTGYQNFFAEKRQDIKTLKPTLSFGEISKEISKLWRSMSNEEKAVYENPTVTIAAKPIQMDDLTQLKMSELKQMCEERKIKRTGNKSELIQLLLTYQNSPNEIEPSSSSSIRINNTGTLEDEDTIITKRSIMEELKITDDEEIDFEDEEIFDEED